MTDSNQQLVAELREGQGPFSLRCKAADAISTLGERVSELERCIEGMSRHAMESAKEVMELNQTVDRLRAALEHYVRKCSECQGRGRWRSGPISWATCRVCKPAREALAGAAHE